MVIFHSYVSLPEGIWTYLNHFEPSWDLTSAWNGQLGKVCELASALPCRGQDEYATGPSLWNDGSTYHQPFFNGRLITNRDKSTCGPTIFCNDPYSISVSIHIRKYSLWTRSQNGFQQGNTCGKTCTLGGPNSASRRLSLIATLHKIYPA